MTEQNICRFTPLRRGSESINTINFVYETNAENFRIQRISAVYIVGIVTEGSGRLCLSSGECQLLCGDVFFVYPSVAYRMESDDGLKFMYISFIGLRGVDIIEKLKIRKGSPVFKGYEGLIPFWKSAIELANVGNSDLCSESVLLYTLANVGNFLLCRDEKKQDPDVIAEVRKYTDDNFSDSSLSLSFIAKSFSYNPKYLSSTFKKHMKISYTSYLTTIRIQHACALMEDGLTSIKDIAFLCGFSDQMYFSKVFSRKMGHSPKAHIAEIHFQP